MALGSVERKLDYNDLDPGIRETVRWLRAAGFSTTDSGDGESKSEAIFDGEALDVPHVVIVTTSTSMVEESRRVRKLIEARIGSVQAGDILATFDPADESAIIMVTNIDDKALGFEAQ